MKAQSDLFAGAVMVSAAVIVTLLVGSMLLSLAKNSANSTENLAESEIQCSYYELYAENASFDSGGDCTRGVNHTLSIVIRNGGQIISKIGNVVIESENGSLSYFYIGQNISPRETRSFSIRDDNSCVNFLVQNQSGYENRIKSIHVGSVSCPSMESIGSSRMIFFNSNQTESITGSYTMGLWHFNDNLIDSSFFGNNGSFFGGIASYGPGVNTSFGKSIQMDGVDDYMLFDSNQSTNNSDQITIELWVKSYSNGSSVVSKCQVYRLNTNNGGEFIIFNESIQYNVSAPGNINDGNWHHIAATFNGDAMKIYLDGMLRAINTSYNGNLLEESSLQLGNDCDYNPDKFFNGSIDEFNVLSVALSSGEIYDNYIKGKK